MIGVNSARALLEEGMKFLGEVGNKQITQAITIHICERRAHIRGRSAHGVESKATRDGFLGKCAVALVDEKTIGPAIIRAENVGPGIPVEIGAD